MALPGVAPWAQKRCESGCDFFVEADVRLTTKRVLKALKRPGRYGDGAGLYLQVVNPSNASWVLRYERSGKETMLGLGPLHTVSLAEARTRARTARLSLLDGVDPLQAKKAAKVQRALAAAKAMTFSDAVRGYLKQHESKWGNPRHALQWRTTLAMAEPIIGSLPVSEIDIPLVLKVLEQKVEARRDIPAGPFWMTRPETASRLRGRIEKVLDWAKARGYRSGDNPAAWSVIGHVLPARRQLAKVNHHPALDYRGVPTFMAALRQRHSVAAQALEFTILTAARTGETIGATWAEIDLNAKTWTVPRDRIKAGKEHRVPLSDRVVELLKAAHRERGNPYVFIGPRRAGLSRAAMTQVLERMGRADITVHGFRSSFRDWAAEQTAYANHVVEQALAHSIGNAVERAYRRGDMFDKRRALMAAWSRYCTTAKPAGGKVVPIRK
jgi:integrase